jgi:hypothetical protein
MITQSMLVGYYTDRGPRRGKLQVGDGETAIPVTDRPGIAGWVVGKALPSGWIEAESGRAALWRLEVGGRSVGGLWVCDGRRFDAL